MVSGRAQRVPLVSLQLVGSHGVLVRAPQWHLLVPLLGLPSLPSW